MLTRHSRGYLPHVEGAKYQMITYRLSDALPKDVLEELHLFSENDQREKIEEMMGRGLGRCVLAYPKIAELIIENWFFFNQDRYEINAYVVMPTHVHLLIRVYEGETLSKIVFSWKSFTASAINKVLLTLKEPTMNPVWQADYWDRYIRDIDHFRAVVEYIHENPIKAGLVSSIEQWPWSSAYKK